MALASFAVLSGLAVVVVLIVALLLLPTLPPITDLAESRLKVPLRVYTVDGELLAEYGEEKRIPVKIEDVPQPLIQAILAAEDHGFYEHHGVDLFGILRAAWYNVRTGSAGQGASTITMQVARNYFLTPEKTYARKFREMLLALKIERELGKEQILELYINKIFLGHRAYGFAAAAQIYYGTTLDKLALPEIAMLAGLPKAPSRDNPITNAASALERRNYVLRHMYELGYIDEPTLTQAQSAPFSAAKHAFKYAFDAPYVGEMVRQYTLKTYDETTSAGGLHVYTTIRGDLQRAANQALRRGLLDYDRRHGWRGPAGRIDARDVGDAEHLNDVLKDYRVVAELLPGIVTHVAEKSATVYTQDGFTAELDWDALAWARRYIDEDSVGAPPTTAGQVLRPGDIVYLEATEASTTTEGETRWRLAQIPALTGAIVSIDPANGAILALSGGLDFEQSSFNRVIQAQRQPGSSLKPFIYTAALEKGFTAATTVSGAPIVIEDAALEDVWRPENYSREFTGPTRLRRALALSLNLVSIRLLRAIGAGYTVDYLTRFGFDPERLPRNLSLALGTASATPLEMTSAFAVYANGGFRVAPYFISRIEDSRNTVLEQAQPARACPKCPVEGADPAGGTVKMPAGNWAPRAVNPEVNFIITSMLQDVIRDGTAKAALALGRTDLAGKTGTTDDYRDAWFSGFNASMVTTVWVGFDQPASLGRGEAGGRASLPIWIDYMRAALAGVPEQPPTPPPGVITMRVNSETGKPADASDPNAIDEYFVKGTETPVQVTTDGEPVAPAPVQEDIREQLF